MDGFAENVRSGLAAVGTASGLISQARNRQEVIISNSSAGGQTITLNFANAGAAGEGVVLLPGYTYYASSAQGFKVFSGEIWAVSSAAGGQISIFER